MQQAAGRTPVLTPSGSPLKFEAPAGRLYLGGEWVPPVRGGSLATLNPATEQVICQVPLATAEDVDAAVKAARAAFGGWGDTSGAERARYLRDIAQGIENRKEELAVIESLDCGKPLREAQGDVGEAVVYFRYYAQLAETLDAEQEASVALSNEPNFRVSVRKEPVGVVAAITPWNYPLLMATQKVAAALAAGCAVVLKPSELSPLTALELAAIAHTVGLPGGVLNVLPGDGPHTGAPLVAHTGVDKVSFTGSVATGSRILAAAVPDIKKVSLELGGKSAMLVFEDADLDAAVEWIMFGIFFNQGQVCSATSRLLVQESIADELVRKLQQEVQKLRLGDPLTCEPPCMGPLISQPQLDKVLRYIQTGLQDGAELVAGGGRPTNLSQGFFVEPTIFRGVPQDSALWREEIFGPVLAIRTFNTEEEALQEANNTTYGLAAAVLSRDPQRCKRVARAFRTGVVWVNCSQPAFVQAPWGGMKKSGMGRELGPWGLDAFLEVKQICAWDGSHWGWFDTPK